MHLAKSNLTGSGAPTSETPEYVGQIYYDTTNNVEYIALSTSIGDFYKVKSIDTPGSNSSNVIYSNTLSSANQYIYVPDKYLYRYSYDIELLVFNSSANGLSKININGDYTDSDYNLKYVTCDGSSLVNNVSLVPNIIRSKNGYQTKAYIKIRHINGWYWIFSSFTPDDNSDSTVNDITYALRYANQTAEPIKEIRFNSSALTNFAIGTKITLYRPTWVTSLATNQYKKIRVLAKDFVDGSPAPSSLTTINNGDGSFEVRKFDPSTEEFLIKKWTVPEDYAGHNYLFVDFTSVITEATAPTSGQGVAYRLAIYKVDKNGGNLNGTYGSNIVSSIANLNSINVNSQYDIFRLDKILVEVSNLESGDSLMFKISRYVGHADDDYGQDIGLVSMQIQYRSKNAY
ncbi:MAG: hypothetical protein BV456_06840 [Thermoplasmata archaeon M8B2D]|nr:MAG: hypothetical protein BV456_06840 [Thermoplasmata archaeon M8B2D]